MPRRTFSLAALCLAAAACAQVGDKAGEPQVPIVPANLIPPSPPLTAEEALRSFKVAPGYRIELVAEAPLVRHPTVLQFGPDGRLWVVEMTGYMENFDPTFLALYTTPDKLAALAKDFKVYYKRVDGQTPTSYTMDHSAGSYIYDTKGNLRLFTRYGSGAKVLAADIQQLLKS